MAIKIRSSRNPDVMDKNIQRLADGLNDLDVEIPEHSSADAGKYLGVDSSGDLEFSDPFPDTTGASTGDVLGLTGEGKVPNWITPYTPPAYSSTAEVNTGQKWVDGKDIYCKVFSGTYPEISSQSNQVVGNLDFDNIIGSTLFHIAPTNTTVQNNVILYNKNNKYITVIAVSTAYSQYDYNLIVYYTKPDPEPSPENENRETEETEEPVTKTRKKSTK